MYTLRFGKSIRFVLRIIKENHTQNITLENILETANYSTQQSFCAGCENQCKGTHSKKEKTYII